MTKQLKLPLTALSIALLSLSSLAFAEANVKDAEAKTEAPAVEATTAKSDEKPMSMEDQIKVMAHVSPIPSLMMVLAKNEDALKLDDKQKEVFKAFREEHGAKGKELAKAIMTEEKAVMEAVLAGEDSEKITEMLKGVMDKREKISAAKLACRDNMKKTLSEEQWNQVVELYKASKAS